MRKSPVEIFWGHSWITVISLCTVGLIREDADLLGGKFESEHLYNENFREEYPMSLWG